MCYNMLHTFNKLIICIHLLVFFCYIPCDDVLLLDQPILGLEQKFQVYRTTLRHISGVVSWEKVVFSFFPQWNISTNTFSQFTHQACSFAVSQPIGNFLSSSAFRHAVRGRRAVNEAEVKVVKERLECT